MKLFVKNETSRLKSVLLGNANNIEKKPSIYQTYDPLSIINLKRGTYPKKSDLIKNIDKYPIIVTPHIGGMTIEGQTKAFMHAVKKFKRLS